MGPEVHRRGRESLWAICQNPPECSENSEHKFLTCGPHPIWRCQKLWGHGLRHLHRLLQSTGVVVFIYVLLNKLWRSRELKKKNLPMNAKGNQSSLICLRTSWILAGEEIPSFAQSVHISKRTRTLDGLLHWAVSYLRATCKPSWVNLMLSLVKFFNLEKLLNTRINIQYNIQAVSQLWTHIISKWCWMCTWGWHSSQDATAFRLPEKCGSELEDKSTSKLCRGDR